MDIYDVIIRPIVFSEKANRLRDESNQYVFLVHDRANKVQIREAVESLFNVKVTGVRTLIRRGHMARMGMRRGQRISRKRAIVTLREGDSIELFK
jgi:large subunit ribosomal protein L23